MKDKEETEKNTKMVLCSCRNRSTVHNRTKQNKNKTERKWRCTVCGKEKE